MGEPIQVGGGFDRCEKCGEEYHNSILHECPPADPAGAARNEPGCPRCLKITNRMCSTCGLCVVCCDQKPAPPASEAGHREDGDEGLDRMPPGFLILLDKAEDWLEASKLANRDYATAQQGIAADLKRKAFVEFVHASVRENPKTLQTGLAMVRSLLARLRQLRAYGERLRASDHRLAGVLLGEVQRAREEAAREGMEEAAKVCESRAEGKRRYAETHDGYGHSAADEAEKCAMAIRAALRRQPPGAAGNAPGGNE